MAAKKKDVLKANRLVSQFIRKIATEQTELVNNPERGDELVTKAEALARTIWKKALGYTETKVDAKGPMDISHEPDKGYINLVLDRLEGTARPTVGNANGRSTTQKIRDEGKKRINGILGKKSAPPED